MPFQYVAYTEEGDLIRGAAEAASAASVEEMLWRNAYYIVNIKEVPPPTHWRDQFPTIFGVGVRDVIVLTRQLATLVNSGVPLLQALVLLQGQLDHPAFRRALDEIIHDVETGTPVSTALRKFPLIFPEIYNRMVEVGERTGRLEQVLEQIAVYMEKQQAILGRVRGALMYPTFIALLASGAVGMLVTFALPAMVGIFKEFNANLPLSTRILVAVADFAEAYFTSVLVGIAMLAVLLTAYAGTTTGKYQFHSVLLKLPLLGQIMIKGNLANFTRSMAILLRAGIPLPEIMDLTTETVDNVVIQASFRQVKAGLLQGHGLSFPLEQDPLFPKLLSSMVKVGEESGALDAILLAVADFYEKETERSIDEFTSKIEPTMILVVGAVVGFIALAVITPMYSLIGAIGK